MNRLSCAAIFLALLGGCSVEPYCFDCVDDAGRGIDASDGGVGDGGARPDVLVDAPMDDVVVPPDGSCSTEICNGVDDNCNGMIDEGFDLTRDPDHCGSCDTRCTPPHAFASCTAGVCGIAACQFEYFDRNGMVADGCEVHCVATGAEVCNLRDDNCNGMVDEGFDLTSDANNCGACGRVCRLPHATSTCTAGACAVASCDPGFHDADGLAITGCEYACTATGPETCNLRDDDCNGMVDEGDPGGGTGCGSSVGLCVAGVQHCVSGALTCVGGVSPVTEICDGLDNDCDGTADNGNPGSGAVCGPSMGVCVPGRMTCTGGALVCVGATGPSAEICDGLDNDCDGTVDNGNPGGGASCGITRGQCVAGTITCAGGSLSCVGAIGPSLEICDGIDNDCNGVVDDGYNLATDPRNCGACGNVCTYPNALGLCSASTCVMGPCNTGFVNLDGMAANGCEYACNFTGAEACNGLDDNCNGMVDEGLTAPSTFCLPNGVCAGTLPVCGGAAGWTCSYPSTYQTTETRCDGLDNDCDGFVDEPFPNVGLACDNGSLGRCRTTGTFVCNGTGTATVCNAPAGAAPITETCNNIDDDCDGLRDEQSPASWVQITVGGASRWIFQYEASRPDSTATAQGTATHRACGDPNRMPWTSVTPIQAAAACTAIGARLCTEAEWQQACQTAAATPCTYSYQTACTTYAANTCNGLDHDIDAAMAGIQNGLVPTGSMASCDANWGTAALRIYDMSGNAQEWTAPRAAGVNPERGGSYNDISGGMSCTFNFEVAGNTFAAPNTGFRCCSSTLPVPL